MGTGGHNVPLIKDDFGFRKLTPRECFNLQGFPRDYKFPQDIAISQLYKQAGNSVTVEMISVLAKTIKEALESK
jgi:DNA (cytosine-5)-methyltransferase 1